MEQPRTPTPLDPAELASRMVVAIEDRTGKSPDRNRAELLLALLYLENDRGRAILNHNWGNVSTRARDGIDYWRPPWFDIDAIDDADPKKPRYVELHNGMLQGKVPEAFLSLVSHEVGADRWLSAVPKSMLDAATSGDPFAFASAYFTSKYCPDAACRDSGPSFAKLQKEIRADGFFDSLPLASNAAGAGAGSGSGSSAAPTVAILSVGVALGIFWAVLRTRPGSRVHA